MLPLVGRLSDLHGRVPVLLGCLTLFVAGSVLTATADSPRARWSSGATLQGVGGGGLVPVTLALVADGWPPGRAGCRWASSAPRRSSAPWSGRCSVPWCWP